MLAIRDENVVNAAQAAQQAQGKRHLAAKTPGTRFLKTPSKIPLNDENATGGKTVAGKTNGKANQSARGRALVTPLHTQARAPLGIKTTNAKTKTNQTLGVKDIVKEFEKTQAQSTTVRKIRQTSGISESIKVPVLQDTESDESHVEHAPNNVKALPYESDVFPDGTLKFEGLKRENMFKGYYNHFYNPVGEDGQTLADRKHDMRMKKAMKKNDDDILRDIDAMDWAITEVPRTNPTKTTAPTPKEPATNGQPYSRINTKYPGTITSRTAASALSVASGSTTTQKKPLKAESARRLGTSLLPSKKPIVGTRVGADSLTGEAASRSTLGYTKGRSASSLVNGKRAMPSRVEPAKAAPVGGNATGPGQGLTAGHDDLQRLQFLSIFDADDEDVRLAAIPTFDDSDGEVDLEFKV